ncbi:MAG TPA: phosphotransferase, partial [Microlunatus sp.]|nr:phosphotransferase [Microlunatus sp.]
DVSVPRHARMSAAVATHLRDPMRRSAYALIVATGLTSGLGLVFWALAARWLPTATVGIGAALVSVMALLANLSTLGLRNGLIRFLPTAGSASRRLIVTCYALCAVTAMVAAGIFLLGQPLWAARLAFLRDSPLAALAFVLGTAFWVLFVLQDHVLVGLRQTIWVPLENGLCAVAKIALLPLLALAGGWAVFGAAALPAATAVLVVTTLIMRYLRRTTAGQERTAIPVSQLVRFAAADHFAALLWMGTADLLTLLVLNQVGPEASAYYFMANTIGYTLYLVISNIGSALVAEGARDPERAVSLARQALWNSARLVIPLAVVGVLVAPFVLGILGPDYAANGTLVLQLLLVSAIPQTIVGIAIATARIRRDLRTIMVVYAALAIGSIGGSRLALGPLGIPGVGLACLLTQLVVCAALLITGRTGLFAERGVRSVIAELEQLPRRWRRRRSRRATRHQLAPALTACGLDPQTPYRMLTSDSDTLVVALEAEPDRLIVKIATSAAASRGLGQHVDSLAQLGSLLDGHASADLLPRVVRDGRLGGNRVVIETQLPGHAATRRLSDPATSTAAAAALSPIHRATASTQTVDQAVLARWVDEPLAYLRGLRGLPGDAQSLDRLQALLHEALLGREVEVAWVHGDFWPGNVLVHPVGGAAPTESGEGDEGLRVTGVVDWENAHAAGLPDVDLMHWWLSTRPVELGFAVLQALADPDAVRRGLAELSISLPNPQIALEHLVLLTWLGHVTAGMDRTSADHLGRVWLARNVKPILHLLAGSEPVGPDPVGPLSSGTS